MGRNAVITYEQVRTAAEELRAIGVTPSVKKIRPMIGDVGSMGTINKYLKMWEGSREPEPASLRQLPTSLQHTILAFADDQAGRARTEIAAELLQAKQELTEMSDDNERQFRLAEQQLSEIDRLITINAQVAGKQAQLSEENSALRVEIGFERNASEHARIELAKAQIRIDALCALEADLGKAQAELRTEHQARVAADKAAAVLTAEKAQLLERLTEARCTLLDPRPLSLSVEPESTVLIGRGRRVKPAAANKSSAVGPENSSVEPTSLERTNNISAERQGDLLEALRIQEGASPDGILAAAGKAAPSS